MKAWIKITCIVLPALLFLVVITEWRSREQLSLARQAMAQPDVDKALKHYARSINWYLPFGTAERAAEELLNQGLAWADQGKKREAALALSRMRSGLYGARSFYTPRKDLIEKAEPVLARLRALSRIEEKPGQESLEALTARYLSYLQEPIRPSTWSGMAASFGFLVWVFGVLWFIFRFFSGHPPRLRKSALYGAAVAVIGLAVWIWGMVNA